LITATLKRVSEMGKTGEQEEKATIQEESDSLTDRRQDECRIVHLETATWKSRLQHIDEELHSPERSTAMRVKEPSFVLTDGPRMAYDEVCPADPKGTILLLPGSDSNRLIWYKQLDVFGRAFRTIAVDCRDTGDSEPASEAYTIADLADDAASMLAALGVQQAHVVGVSLGGYVALQMVLRHPEQVEKLVLVSTSATYIPPSPEMMAQMEQLQQDQHVEAGERMQRILALVTAPGYFANHTQDWDRIAEWARYRPQRQEAAVHQMQACITYDVSGQLDHIQVPTLVVHGELDPRVAPENSRFLAEHIPDARFMLYPNTGHLVIIERAEEFNRDVLAFLQE
jgi:3-oxoadipate enol-lactonase